MKKRHKRKEEAAANSPRPSGSTHEKGDDENRHESGNDDNANIHDDISLFLATILSLKDGQSQCPGPPEIPDSTIDRMISMVNKDIARCEADGGDRLNMPLLDSIEQLSSLSASLSNFSSHPNYAKAAQSTGKALQNAMPFLKEELRLLLEDSRTNSDTPTGGECNSGEYRVLSAAATKSNARQAPLCPPKTVEKLRRIADTMITGGCEFDCCQTFTAARRSAFNARLSDIGFGKVSTSDVQKMAWQSLEGEVVTWIEAFRESISFLLYRERSLCETVFAGHCVVARSLFSSLARSIVTQLLNFAEAVATTNRSAEKLFKVLDMYETVRDMLPEIAGLFPGEEEATDLKSEISTARSRLGEAAVATFCELESSIRADASKGPVPGGAVHPLARHVMTYLEHACDYKSSLEQVFVENGKNSGSSPSESELTPFAAQLVVVMDLLDSNVVAKSKLYKDAALSYIFLMNNGRYIAKKIKESGDIFGLLGDNWHRKRLSVLREYHKSYQRETWSKVLGCFKEEGLQAKGSVSKPVLKERLKSFNAMIEDIRKTQSVWIVSDEQMQSELRVSISAVIVPAYRSFIGRYTHYLNSKQHGKYVKFSPEDLETYVDGLFVGSHSNHGRKRT